jgi:hypothetical protein
MDHSPIAQPIDCPRCSSQDVALLAFMRRYHQSQDWFRCDGCGHIFCRPKQNVWRSKLVAVHGQNRGREVA